MVTNKFSSTFIPSNGLRRHFSFRVLCVLVASFVSSLCFRVLLLVVVLVEPFLFHLDVSLPT